MLKSHKFTLVVCLQFCLLFQALARVYYVSPAGSSHNDALSWGGALDSVQGAIDRAGPGDQVWVAGGSYQPAEQAERPGTLNPLANSFVLKDGVCLYGGFQGDESRLEDRSRADLDGNGLVEAWEFVNPSLLCAASLRPGTVLYGGTQDFTQLTVIDGFSICQGLAEGGGAAGEGGGALLPGNCVLQNCRVFDNLARAGGGAALRGNAVARRCLFTHNGLLEEGWFGLGAAVLLHDEARLENCLLINNAAAYSGGGGVAVMAEGSIEHCSIAKNLAGAAGSGVCFLGNGGSMSNSLLWGNGGHECQLRIGAQTLLHNNAVQGIYCLPGCIGLQNDNVGENGAEANDNRIDCYYACFVEPEADNYRLAAGSYLLNRALPGNNEDCAGRARTETPYADIGCYEESWPGNLCADFQVEMPLLYAQNSRVQGVLGALCPDELEASFSSENGNVSWQELDNLSAELNASKSGCWTLSMSLLPDAPLAAHWNSFSFEHEVCIRPRPLLLKADDKLWQWGSEAPELTWSLLCGSLAEGDSIAGAPFVELPDESGEYPIEQGSLLVQDGSGGSDYELHFLPGLLTCVKGEAQLYLDDFCCVYEGRPVNMPVQTYPPGLQVKLNFEGVDGTPYANSELPPKDCGRYLVRASIVDGYFGGEAIANLEITAASLLCRADDQQRAYLSPNPVFTISYEGFLGGDSQFDIVAPQALCAATEFSPVREEGYEILLQGGSARNYVLELHSGRLMLSKCAPQCNEVLISEGMYGMPLEHIMIMAYAISPQGGYVPGYFIWDSPAQLLHAGLWQCSWQFMPEDSGSFLGFSGSSLVSMVKRPLEVTALNQSKVYGEPDPELTLLVTAGSLVLGDSFNGKLQREGGENIGEYSIGQGSLSLNDSYQMSFLPGAFSIEPRLVRLQALATSKYQGEEDPPLNWQFLEGSLGFNDVFSGSLERQPGEEPGEYEILQGSLRLSSNYELLYQSGIFTLLPPPFMLLGELSLQPLSYGEALSAELLEGQVCNTITGENVPGSFVWDEEGAFLPAGNHELTWTFVPEEAVVFMPLSGTCEVEIQKARLQVSLQGEFKRKYGQPNPEFALLFDGFQFDEDENDLDEKPEIVCLAEIDSLPGKYAVALQGGASDNYSFEFEDKTLTVQFLQVAVQALAQSKEYGQPDPELSYSYSGEMLPGDSFAGTLKRASGENLGLYAINLGSLSLPPYYKLSFTTENLYIGQAQICVKAADLTHIYGLKMPTLTYEVVSGALRTGDRFNGALACEAWQQWVGEYPVTQGSLSLSQNYLLEFIPGSVQVQPRPLTITAGNLNKYYSQADPKNTLSYTTSGSLVSGDSWLGSLEREAGEEPGLYVISQGSLAVSPAENYSLDFVPGSLQINRIKTNGVAFTTGSLKHGDCLNKLSYTISVSASVGDYGKLTGTAVLPEGDKRMRRGVTSEKVIFYPEDLEHFAEYVDYMQVHVTTRAVLVKAHAQTMTYGEAIPELSYEETEGYEFFEGEAFSGELYLYVNGSSTPVAELGTLPQGAYTIQVGSLKVSEDYRITFTQAQLTVKKRQIQIAGIEAYKYQGQADPDFDFVVVDGEILEGDAFVGALGRVAGEKPGSYSFRLGTLSLGPNYEIVLVNDASLNIVAGGGTYGAASSPTRSMASKPAGLAENSTEPDLDTLSQEPFVAPEMTLLSMEQPEGFAAGEKLEPVRLKARAAAKLFAEADPVFAYELQNAEDCALVLQGQLARQPGEQVGSYAIQLGTLRCADGRALVLEPADFKILPRPLRVKALNQQKHAGEADPVLGWQIVESGHDSLRLYGVLNRQKGELPGDYIISQGSLYLAERNYELQFENGKLSILPPAYLVKNLSAAELLYGQKLGEAALSGNVVYSQGQSLTPGDFAWQQPEKILSAGRHTMAWNFVFSDETLGQLQGECPVVVMPKPLRLLGGKQSKRRGEADPELTYSLEDAESIPTPTLQGALQRQPGEEPGVYGTTLGSLNAGDNYQLEFLPGSLSIQAEELLVCSKWAQIYQKGENIEYAGHQYQFGAEAFASIEEALPLLADGGKLLILPGEYRSPQGWKLERSARLLAVCTEESFPLLQSSMEISGAGAKNILLEGLVFLQEDKTTESCCLLIDKGASAITLRNNIFMGAINALKVLAVNELHMQGNIIESGACCLLFGRAGQKMPCCTGVLMQQNTFRAAATADPDYRHIIVHDDYINLNGILPAWNNSFGQFEVNQQSQPAVIEQVKRLISDKEQPGWPGKAELRLQEKPSR